MYIDFTSDEIQQYGALLDLNIFEKMDAVTEAKPDVFDFDELKTNLRMGARVIGFMGITAKSNDDDGPIHEGLLSMAKYMLAFIGAGIPRSANGEVPTSTITQNRHKQITSFFVHSEVSPTVSTDDLTSRTPSCDINTYHDPSIGCLHHIAFTDNGCKRAYQIVREMQTATEFHAYMNGIGAFDENRAKAERSRQQLIDLIDNLEHKLGVSIPSSILTQGGENVAKATNTIH